MVRWRLSRDDGDVLNRVLAREQKPCRLRRGFGG
jgi:hypothetical protein